mgnify:FL=1
MRVLVIGSSGFIGSFLVEALLRKGYEVVGMDIQPPRKQDPRFVFMRGDILKKEDIAKAAAGCQAVISLAAAHKDFGISEQEYFQVNRDGTGNVLDVVAGAGIKKFIFYSSVAVYGNPDGFATEETIPEPVNTYGKSKLAGEKLIPSWVQADASREAVVIRPVVIFGPGNFGNMFTLINAICKKRFMCVGKGDNIKSVAYVENLVDATIFAFAGMKPGLAVYNYADYPEMTITQTVQTIYECLGIRQPRFRLPLRPALFGASIFDVLGKITGINFPITAYRIRKFNTATRFKADKIRSLGFQQRVPLKEGFKRMLDWYAANKDTAVGSSTSE